VAGGGRAGVCAGTQRGQKAGALSRCWRSGDAAGLVRLNLDRRRVVEDVDIWPSPLVYGTKLARSLYFAHVVEHADRMQPWTFRVVRVDADGETERLDVPLPPDIRSSSGISPAGMTDIIASGNRLYAISTVRGRFDDGELRRRDVVAIDRLR